MFQICRLGRGEENTVLVLVLGCALECNGHKRTGIVEVVDMDGLDVIDGWELFVLTAPAAEGGYGVCAVHLGCTGSSRHRISNGFESKEPA